MQNRKHAVAYRVSNRFDKYNASYHTSQCLYNDKSQFCLHFVHEVLLVNHFQLSVPAVVGQQGYILSCHRAHLHRTPSPFDSIQEVQVFMQLHRRQALGASVVRVRQPVCDLHGVVGLKKCLQVALLQGFWGKDLVDAGLLRLLSAEAGGYVDRTDAGGAVEEKSRCVCGQDAGKREELWVGEAEVRAV